MFLAGGAVLCFIASVVLLLQPHPDLKFLHRVMAAGSALVGALFAWLSMPSAPLGPKDRVLVAAVLGIALVDLLAWWLGTGLRTVALGIVPLLVGLAALLAGGWRAGIVLGVAVSGVAALAWHDQHTGPAAFIQAWQRLTPGSALWSHVVMLAGGLIFGMVARALVQRWRALAEQRERHFRELLAAAANLYAELDADLRFTRPTVDLPLAAGPLPEAFIGQHPWTAPGLVFVSEG